MVTLCLRKLTYKDKEQMQNSRVDIFDGIRGWGAIMVLLSHLCGTIPHMTFLRKTPLAVATDGFLAVYIFFILSGIVLSLSYFKYNDLICIASLLIKRLPRLAIPIFASSCFVYFIMVCHLMYNKNINNSWLSEFYSFNASIIDALKFSFFGVFFNYVNALSYNVVLWTMSIELYGSMLVALVLLCLSYTRFKLSGLIMVFLILFVAAETPSGENPSAQSVMYSSLACFSVGIIICYMYINKKEVFSWLSNRNVKIFLFVIFLLIYKVVSLDRCNVIAAAIIVLLPFMFTGVQSFLVSGVSRFLGKISFPLYIVHFPILCSFTSYMLLHYGNSYPVLGAITLASIALSIFTAFLLLPVERFSIRISRRVADYVLVQRQ